MIVVAEKPSVARAIMRAVRPEAEVVALSGHLLELDFPEKYANWGNIDPAELFQARTRWIIRDKKAYGSLLRALKSSGDPIIFATDNDHEGELIAYEAMLIARETLSKLNYMRMRFNTVADNELREAWRNLEPDLNWGWVEKALFRHKFDLIVGAAYTRLLTLTARKNGVAVKLVSYGSCQTPTLWFVYERDMEIRNFKPEVYYVVWAVLDDRGTRVKVSTSPIRDRSEAEKLYKIAKNAKNALVKEYILKAEEEQKPLPTDTDTMLQELTKILGVSGNRIMASAEDLYAEGFISYPRTETNMWVRVNHREILKMLAETPLSKFTALQDLNPIEGRKNDGAHPPIHPIKPYLANDWKGKIWEYIARRYLANVAGRNALFERWKLSVELDGVPMEASGKYFIHEGFYEVFPYFRPKDLHWIPELRKGQMLPVIEVQLDEKKTKPPPHLTESELLRLMERNGIGTDATRHLFPSLIVERGYAFKRRKSFVMTSHGEALINLLMAVDKRLVTPETRRFAERMMAEVEARRISLDEALSQSLKVYEMLYAKLREHVEKTWPRPE
ncbi:MAG: DNA topoisomerase [Candidatus Bathyarchaeia archaeon]